MAEYIGLLFELIFLGIGIYVYLFAIGLVKFKNPKAKAKAEAFRKDNNFLLRMLALLLIAVMGMNVAIHLYTLFKG